MIVFSIGLALGPLVCCIKVARRSLVLGKIQCKYKIFRRTKIWQKISNETIIKNGSRDPGVLDC